MNFKFLKKNNTNVIFDKKIKYEKYNHLLSNLLAIKSRGDSAIFTKLSSMNLDLVSLLDEKDLNKLFKNTDFKIKLKRDNIALINQRLKKINNYDELVSYIEQENISINATYLKNIKDKIIKIEEAIETIVSKLEQDKTLYLTKWKRYIKQLNDTYEQTNMWPLFVGTYFIKIKLNDKIIYAPLIIKEVEISIINNDVFLVSRNSTTFLNDKLIFFLEQGLDIQLPQINNDEEKISINDLINELNDYLKNIIDVDSFDLLNKFNNLRAQDIHNRNLTLTSGVCLVFCQPTGGALRKATLDLINEDKIENLININPDDFFNVENKAIHNIVQEPKKIVRICPTDPSQERAILSALENHTIIIGPPGTGKSQTIANILTNIMINNKTALFISQKRVALQVVLERMQELQFFTLQLVEHQQKTSLNEKKEFYKYLNSFLNIIKNESETFEFEKIANSFVSNNKINYWKTKDQNDKLSQREIDIFCKLKKEIPKLDIEMIKQLKNIFLEFKQIDRYDQIEKLFDIHEKELKEFAKKLGVSPKKILLIFKKYHSSFIDLWKLNNKFLNVVEKYSINKKALNILKEIKDYSFINCLNDIFYEHEKELSKSNEFVNNKNELLAIIANRTKKVYNELHKKDSSWSSKFLGRIQREFTQPSKFINLFKEQLKSLFHIIVSTPETLSSFLDFKNDKFDYVIFDEASQMFLEKAIPYIAIGKTIIVAGDDQQMQPSNWFDLRIEASENEKEDEKTDSLLSYAIEKGIPKHTLELNYRSVSANLTSFSSKHFYNSELKTLDKNDHIIKPIEVIDVNGEWNDGINAIEAEKMIEILKQNISKYNRIILLTLNLKQMQHVDFLLSQYNPEIYEKLISGELILKNLENIQGDEADLVIISVGYTNKTSLASTYVCKKGGRNALNVAITRAREKLIIIKSINSKEINVRNENNSDLITFKNWINFLELNEKDQKTYSLIENGNSNKSVESNFEHEVFNWLKTIKLNKELKIEIQYPIGSYRIDVALLDVNTNKFVLGIEIDGYKYHNTPRQRYNDLIRETFIVSKGYSLIRISELLWKTDKNKIIELINQNI